MYKIAFIRLLLAVLILFSSFSNDTFAQQYAVDTSMTLDQIRDSARKKVNEFFDEILDLEVAVAALQTRHISNVGYGLDNVIGLNGELHDTFKMLRTIVQSELFIKSAVKYDHFWTNLINRSNYSPNDNELSRKYDDELYFNKIYFDVTFTPAWDTVRLDVDAAREKDSIAWICRIDVWNTGTFTAEFDPDEMDSVISIAMGANRFEKIKREASPVVNESMFAGLGWLAEKFGYEPFPNPTNIKHVEFTANTDKGFDSYDNKGILANNYDNISIAGKQYYVPWHSATTNGGQTITLKAHVVPVDAEEAIDDSVTFVTTAGAPIETTKNPETGDYTFSIASSLATGGLGILAQYSYTDSTGKEVTNTVGQVNLSGYTLQPMNVVVVPVNSISVPFSAKQLQDTLNSIYGQAATSWTVTFADNFDATAVYAGGGLDDGESGLLTNYSDQMNDLIDAYKDKDGVDIDKETCYLFLVDQAKSGTGKCGYMPLKRQFGFIFANSECSGHILQTFAHELGHGPFRLYHTFSDENEYTQSPHTTDNLMDYKADGKNKRLYKYQWDLIHDPEAMIGLLQDDEEGASFWDESIDVYNHIEKFRCGYINSNEVKFDFTSRKRYNAEDVVLGDNITYEYVGFEGFNMGGGLSFSPEDLISEENYNNGRTKLLVYKPCPESSCVNFSFYINTSQKESFKKYLFYKGSEQEYATQINKLLEQYLNFSTSKFTNLVNNLPECSFKNITAINAIKSLSKLASESMNGGNLNGISEEKLAINLINSCNEPSKLTDYFKYDAYRATLHNLDVQFNDLEYVSPDNNYFEFVLSIINLIKNSKIENHEIIGDKVIIDIEEETKVYRIKDPGILARHDNVDITANGGMNLILYNSSAVNSNGNYFHHYFDDWVILYFEEAVNQLNIKAGDIKPFPAYLIRYLVTQENNEDFRTGLSTAIDIGSMLFAIGELKAGVSAVRQAFAWADIAASLTNIPITAFGEQIENLPGGKEFVHSYNIVAGLIALMDISSASLDGFTKLNKLAGDEINEIAEFYGKHKDELEEASKEIAESSRQISRLSVPDWFDGLPDGLISDIGDIESDLGKLFANAKEVERKSLVESWKALGDFPTLRKNIPNLETLEKVKGRFTYNGKTGQAALEEVFTGHKSVQKFIDNFKRYDDLIGEVDDITITGIKSSSEVRILNNGSQVGKIVDGNLSVKYSGFGSDIVCDASKTTTGIGKYNPPGDVGTKQIIESKLSKYVKAGEENPGGLNILADNRTNIDWSDEPLVWKEVNEPWLNAAISRGDIIRAVSNPMDVNNVFKATDNIPSSVLSSPENLANYLKNLNDPNIIKDLSFYGREVRHLYQNNYLFDLTSKTFVR